MSALSKAVQKLHANTSHNSSPTPTSWSFAFDKKETTNSALLYLASNGKSHTKDL